MRFLLVGNKSNPMLSATQVTLNHLEAIPFMQIKPKTQPRNIQPEQEQVREHFNKIIQLESYYSIKEAIKSNLGVGILPENLLVDDIDKLQVLPITELQFDRKIYLVSSQEPQQTTAQFINYIQTDFKIDQL